MECGNVIAILLIIFTIIPAQSDDTVYTEVNTQRYTNRFCQEDEAYFGVDDDCIRVEYEHKHKYSVQMNVVDPITVEGFELHNFLNSLLGTSFEDVVLSVNKAVTLLDVQSNTLTTITIESANGVLENLSVAYDDAFDEIRNSLFLFIDYSDSFGESIIGCFFNGVYALHYSLHEVVDILGSTTGSALTLQTIQKVQHAALKIGFAIKGLAEIASEFPVVNDVDTTANNIQLVIGTVYVDLCGLLQFALDIAEDVNTGLNNLNGHRSDVISAVQMIINDLLSSLIDCLSTLPDVLNGTQAETISYFNIVRDDFQIAITTFTDKLKYLIGTVENRLGLVLDYVNSFKKQFSYLTTQLTAITLENSNSILTNFKHRINGVFDTLDFPMYVIKVAMPNELLPVSDDLNTTILKLEVQMRSLLESSALPTSKSIISNTEAESIALIETYDKFLAAVFKFQIAASAYSTEIVAEMVASIGLMLECYATLFCKLSTLTNNLLQLFADTTSPTITAMSMLNKYVDLAVAANYIMPLTLEMFSATKETVPTILGKINKAFGDAFIIILSVNSVEARKVPISLSPVMTQITSGLGALQLAVQKLLSTTISIAGKEFENSGMAEIEANAKALAATVKTVLDLITQLISKCVINNLVELTIAAIMRQLATTVLQILFHIVFSIEYYLEIFKATKNSLLLAVSKTFISALSNLTIPLVGITEFVTGGVNGVKQLDNQLISSITSSLHTLRAELTPFIETNHGQIVVEDDHIQLIASESDIDINSSTDGQQSVHQNMENVIVMHKKSVKQIVDESLEHTK